MKKSLRDLAREINEESITKKERRLLKRFGHNPMITVKVFPMDLNIYLSHGWQVLSHTQSTYASNQSYMMKINTAVLKARLEDAATV